MTEGAASDTGGGAGGEDERRSQGSLLRENVEAIIVAFVLALLIRQYAVEAFVIPTGSMAPTLLGAHVDVGCPNCGRAQAYGVHLESANAGLFNSDVKNFRGTCGRCNYEGDYRVMPEAAPRGEAEVTCTRCQATVMAHPIKDVHGDRVATCWCPNCGIEYDNNVDTEKWPWGDISRGDRILVDKLSYHVGSPRRFEVAVFKYPKQPTENYIKRLIGLPNETIDVRDGDIFVDGKIARKPDALQEQLWRPIHESRFVEKDEGSGERRKAWKQEGTWSRIDDGRGWKGEAPAAAKGAKSAPAAWLVYDRPIRDENTYNDGRPGQRGNTSAGNQPVGDVRIRFRAKPLTPGARILARITVDDVPVDVEVGGGAPPRFAFRGGQEMRVATSQAGAQDERTIDLARVDAELILTLDGAIAGRFKLGDEPHEPEVRNVDVRLGVSGGAAEFREIGVYKDVCYLARTGNAGTFRFPLRIPADRYFFMGDNSPSSRDGREWGTVPASHLVGRAFLVFWPAVPGDFAIRRIR